MTGPSRYVRIWFALARYGLTRELAFRGNFLVKVVVEVLWLGLLLAFYDVVFRKTDTVATWTREQYFFFVGCFYALEGTIETLFLSNCSEFADLVRTGDLDLYLVRPIDEQFLISCRTFEWSTVPNILFGSCVMLLSLRDLHWQFAPGAVLTFGMLFVCGVAIAYSCMLMLSSASIWMMRNQNLLEMWWLFTSLMRYPKEIFSGTWAYPIGWFFTFIIPILLVINVPADVMIRGLFEPWLIGMTMLAAVVFLAISRWFFRYALRRYRSASS